MSHPVVSVVAVASPEQFSTTGDIMTHGTTRIRGFDDALAAAAALYDRFHHCHAAALLDDDGAVVDLTPFTSIRHSIDDPLDWAHCMVLNKPRVTRLVLLSALPSGVEEVQEAHLDTLRLAREIFGREGVEVLDWIQADGVEIRSLALIAGLRTWRGSS